MKMATRREMGTFSTGQEDLPAAVEHERMGSFAEGQAQRDEQGAAGRFSTGQESDPMAPQESRIGSFADGEASRTGETEPSEPSIR
jgi:hypothetical protein